MSERGESVGAYSQADVVDAYGFRLQEELEYENVRTQHVNTRKTPVRTEAERLREAPTNFVPLILSCDWHPRARTLNSSVVEFSGESLYKLVDAICFSLSEWGRCTVFGHKVSRPVVVDAVAPYIRIKPFALNGPNAGEYMKRLDKLGEDLGRAIGGYLAEKKQGLRG